VAAHAPVERSRPRYGEGREALLVAAIHVVARSGLRKLTYRSVADEAGVTHGLVAHHFGSRDALLAEALQYALNLSVDTSSIRPGSGELGEFAATLADLVSTDPDLQAFQFELVLESRRRPELRPHAEAIYAYYRSTVRESLESFGIHDDDLADLVFAALDGLAFQQVAFDTKDQTARLTRTLRGILASRQP
jgi:AcrR family transcriptional regulator